MKKKFLFQCLIIPAFLIQGNILKAQINKDYFTIENYYKVKWGFAEEFINLWRTNHYPLLKKAIEKGDIISVDAEKPKLHSGEDTRWDFKVTLVFKDAKTAFDAELTTPYKKQLYPDLDKLAKDEQHRFELLIAHWDVMTEKVDLSKQ
jgi:EthD domain